MDKFVVKDKVKKYTYGMMESGATWAFILTNVFWVGILIGSEYTTYMWEGLIVGGVVALICILCYSYVKNVARKKIDVTVDIIFE